MLSCFFLEPRLLTSSSLQKPRGHRVFLRFEEELQTPEETVDTGELMRRKSVQQIEAEDTDAILSSK